MLRILLFALLAWFLYNIIFRFVIPIYRTTRQMKKQFGEMQDRMREQQSGAQSFSESHQPRGQKREQERPAPKGDYLDFEEVR